MLFDGVSLETNSKDGTLKKIVQCVSALLLFRLPTATWESKYE